MPALLGQHQPGDQVGVVFHVGEQDGVTGTQVGPTPGGGHQVHRLGGVLGEDDLLGRVRCSDEPADGDAGRLVAAVGLLGDGVDAAVDVGVGRLVVVVHGVEHRPGSLGGGRRVEVDETLPVDGLAQQREIALAGCDVHCHLRHDS